LAKQFEWQNHDSRELITATGFQKFTKPPRHALAVLRTNLRKPKDWTNPKRHPLPVRLAFFAPNPVGRQSVDPANLHIAEIPTFD